MTLEALDYWWGAFDSEDCASSSAAERYCRFEAPHIPLTVERSFNLERIHEIPGRYAIKTFSGCDTIVEVLEFRIDGETNCIRFVNRGDMAYMTEDPVIQRLDRFLSVVLQFSSHRIFRRR